MTDSTRHLTITSFTSNKAKWFRFFHHVILPKWTSLSKIGASPAFKKIWIWTILTPACAKILEKFPDEIKFQCLNQPLTFQTGLPFSWIILFFCALCVTLGNIIFASRSPKIINDYPSLDTIDINLSHMQISQGMSELLMKERFYISDTHYKTTKEVIDEIWNYYDGDKTLYSLEQESFVNNIAGAEKLNTLLDTKPKAINLLSTARIFADISRRFSRLACAIFYLAAAIGLGMILIQSIRWVVDSL